MIENSFQSNAQPNFTVDRAPRRDEMVRAERKVPKEEEPSEVK